MSRKLSQDVWVLVLVVLFTLVIGFFVTRGRGSSQEFEMFPHRTTYSSRPGGLKGLYDTLRKLDYKVVRHLEPLTSPPADGVLFMAAPRVEVSSQEWQCLRDWIERGNLLVVSVAGTSCEPAVADKIAKLESHPTGPSFLLPEVRSFRVLKNSYILQKTWSFGDDGSFSVPFG